MLTLSVLLSLASCDALDYLNGEESSQKSTEKPTESETPSKDDPFAPLDIIDKLFREKTLFEIDDEAVMNAILKGYVEGTGDRYAEYFTDEEYAALVDEDKGNFVGVGISVVQNAVLNCIEIVNVFPNSPAIEAGVLPGDRIIYIGSGEERTAVSEVGVTIALNMLRGEEGSIAEFTVLRGGDEIEFSIARRSVSKVSVDHHSYTPVGGKKVGIVEISEFDLTTPTAFEKSVDELIAEGCEYFVFDVRNNPGGDLASITAVLSYFLNEGDVVIRVSDRSGNQTKKTIKPVPYIGNYAGCSIFKEKIGKYKDLKCAVLTNDNTASAAELFSAVLKDYKVSFTVGTTTFGKGTMQTTFLLKDKGYKGALKLTTQYYYPPLSDSYEGKGIEPDVPVEIAEELAETNLYLISDEEDNQLAAAIAELEKRAK